jgi:hypothetical protein
LWVRRNVVLELVACEHVSDEPVAVSTPPVVLSGIEQPASHRDHDLLQDGVGS